ncbi:hypothetical protein CSAL01_07475 [Colletotrichum salicis]|uniref:Uncharacterized protein n=1 Tax=Colletotrichum salicis TaxID=1209931 RepID=A0A135V8K7_9PEZI|nr:hypothetical protein CSAL01_07475 [Colletotrichum salicis]
MSTRGAGCLLDRFCKLTSSLEAGGGNQQRGFLSTLIRGILEARIPNFRLRTFALPPHPFAIDGKSAPYYATLSSRHTIVAPHFTITTASVAGALATFMDEESPTLYHANLIVITNIPCFFTIYG